MDNFVVMTHIIATTWGAIVNKVKRDCFNTTIYVVSRFRSYFLDTLKEPVVTGVHLCHINDLRSVNMQDLVHATFYGMEDVTIKYERNLTMKNPKTVLKNIMTKEVWGVLTKGIDGYKPNEVGRIEVCYTDRFGNERCSLYTEERECVLPFSSANVALLSPSLIECRIRCRCKQIDDNGEEVSMCDEEEEADDVGSGVITARRWVPNMKAAEDEDLVYLAMRDILIENKQMVRYMSKDSPYVNCKYEVELELTFSNLQSQLKKFEFTWMNGIPMSP